MLPATPTRVQKATSKKVNRKIRQQTQANIDCYIRADHRTISRRLRELDAEWDVERGLQTNFGIAVLVGLALGVLVNRKWLILSAVSGTFMGVHALLGWCPPVPVFRRLGFRTGSEIDEERFALKAARGDFDELSGFEQDGGGFNINRVLEAVER